MIALATHAHTVAPSALSGPQLHTVPSRIARTLLSSAIGTAHFFANGSLFMAVLILSM